MKKYKILSFIVILIIIFSLFMGNVNYADFDNINSTGTNEIKEENNEKVENDLTKNETDNNEVLDNDINETSNNVSEEKENLVEFEEEKTKEDEITNTEVKALDSKENKEKSITQVIENGTYIISSALNQNIVLDVAWNSWSSGANIDAYNNFKQNNQKFNVTYLGDGYYKMEVVSSGKYLSCASENAQNEDNIIQSDYKDLDNQKWFLEDAGNGYFYVISKKSSLFLDLQGGSADSGTNVEVYKGHFGNNQKFKFNKVDVIKGSKNIQNGTYNISSKGNFDKVFDIHGASDKNNANLELYKRTNDLNQQYELQYLDDGYYKIVVKHSKKVLTVANASIKEGANVMQYDDLGLDAQKWVLRSAGDGYYYIISKCNGLYLDLQGGIANEGTNIDVYTPNYNNWQKFKFYDVEIEAKKTLEPGNYVITTALNSRKAVDIKGDIITNNTGVDIWESNNGNNQKFIVTYLDDGYYTLKAFNSNKVLTVENNNAQNATRVVQKFYGGKDSQKWAIRSVGDGYYELTSKSTGLVLDVQGASSRDGSNIEIYERNNGTNQKFKFTKTEFSSTIADGKYAILAASNNKKAIDIAWGSSNDGANVEIWDSNGGSNQSFYIKYVGNGYYKIEAACSGKLLTVNGTNVEQREDKDLDEQKWVIQKADKDNNYSFRNKSNDYYLDIYYNMMENGTNIEIYNGNDEYSQKFKLEELVYNGIDVSKWQGNIDWGKVRSQVDFAIIRTGARSFDTGTISDDPYCKKNIEGAIANGIPVGAYFFSQAINANEGKEEAERTLNMIRGYNITYPVIIDIESGGRANNISVKDRTEAAKAFCETIKNAGYTPMIYANKNWLLNYLDMDSLSEYDVWLAHYVSGAPQNKSNYQGKYSIWQYSDAGTVNGINGRVDMDICYKKYK